MTLRLHTPVLTLALLAAAAGARAEGAYVGGALSAPDYHTRINGFGDDNGGRGPGLKLYGGYEFTPNFAVEGGVFDLGRTHDTGNGDVRGRGVYVDGVARYEFVPNWSVFGTAGLAQARFRTPAGNDSGPGLKLGAGVQYDITKSMALRVGYDQYRFRNVFDDKPRVGQAVAGLKFGF